MAKVQTFVKGEGDKQVARLVRGKAQAVQAAWDGYRELGDDERDALNAKAEADAKVDTGKLPVDAEAQAAAKAQKGQKTP